MKQFFVPLLVLLLLLIAATPAAADPPQTWYDDDFEEDFLMIDCSAYGYGFEVWDHVIGHVREVGYFDQNGNLIRTLKQIQGTDNLYKSTVPGVFVASGPFRYSEHVDILFYDPNNPDDTLAEVKNTGTAWNVRLSGGVVIRRSGMEVNIIQGVPPNTIWLGTTKWVGLGIFDEQSVCAAVAG